MPATEPRGTTPLPGAPPDNYDLNRWVAAHVLGWAYRERYPGDTQGYFGSVISEELPDFAGDMGAAWQLLDHLDRHGWLVCVWSSARSRDGAGADRRWYCGLARGPWDQGDEGEADEATPARAICIAALRAVGKGALVDGN